MVNDAGFFSLLADPGVYDLSVRPRQNTGFAWFVKPKVEAVASPLDLGEMLMPLPIAYTGVVTAPLDANTVKPVPGAVIRAYVYMTSKTPAGVTTDPTQAESVLQIAETRADGAGNFELLRAREPEVTLSIAPG